MIKKIITYGGIEAVAKGLNRSLILILPLLLPVSEFGKVGLLVAAELILPMFSTLGFDRAILRFYHERFKYKNFTETIISSVIVVQLILTFIIFIFYVLGAKTLFGIPLFPDLFILHINISLINIMQLILNIHRTTEKQKDYIKLKVVFQFLKFISVLALAFIYNDHSCYIWGVFIALAITIFLNRREFKSILVFKFQKTTFKFLFLFCWPFIFHTIASNLIGNIDRFIFEKFLTMQDVGVYTFAFSVASSLSFAFQGASVYLEPQIYSAKNKSAKNQKVRYYLFFTLICGSIGFIALNLIAKFTIPVYFNAYSNSLSLIPIISMGHLFLPFYYSSNYSLVADKKTFSVARISVLSAILNVIILFVLLNFFGVESGAFAFFVSMLFLGIALTITAKFDTNENILLCTSIAACSLILIFLNDLVAYFVFIICLAAFSVLRLKSVSKEI